MNRLFGAFLLVVLASCGFAQWSEPVPLAGPITSDPSLMTWPSINATDNVLYYSKLTGNQQEDICYSTRLSDSTWSAPVPLSATINTGQRELSPAIGPGDSLLYFVTWGRPGGYGSYDIWLSRRLPNGEWGTPENAGPNVNTAAMEWGVFLSRDGRSLYFSTMTENFLDIKKSMWQDSGWGPAVPLPGHVNWFTDDEHVTLPADESFLILTSNRYAPTMQDLWLSHFDGAEWSSLTALPELNSTHREEGASLAPNGLTVYIASARFDSLPYYPRLYVSHQQSPALPSRPDRPRVGQLRIFPNPVNGSTITLGLNEPAGRPFGEDPPSVYVYDVLGRRTALGIVRESRASLQLPCPALPTGKYWLWIDNGHESLSAPFVILK